VNNALLFMLSLVPFTTAWMGENHLVKDLLLFMHGAFSGFIYVYGLVKSIIKAQGDSSLLKKAIGSDLKGKISSAIYVAGIISTFFQPWIGFGLYVTVAMIWVIPDRRIEEVEC